MQQRPLISPAAKQVEAFCICSHIQKYKKFLIINFDRILCYFLPVQKYQYLSGECLFRQMFECTLKTYFSAED